MSRNKTKKAEEDEIDELLQAAQDEISLKLSINSHMSRVAPSYLDSDLYARFQSLKKPSKPSSSSSSKPSTNPKSTTTQSIPAATEGSTNKDDDLLTRFAALKGSSFPSSSPSSSVPPVKDSDRLSKDDHDGDEVERILQWAIDAARLDPSSLTDDEAEINGSDSDDDDDDDDDEDSDDDDYRSKRKSKGNKK